MVKEAESNNAADEKRKEEADVRNEAEQTIFMTEKSIKDLGDKIDKKDKEKAEKEIEDLKEALKKDNIDDIKTKKEKLNESAMALGAKVYEELSKQAQTENKEEDKKDDKKDKNVKDAEYEEK